MCPNDTSGTNLTRYLVPYRLNIDRNNMSVLEKNMTVDMTVESTISSTIRVTRDIIDCK